MFFLERGALITRLAQSVNKHCVIFGISLEPSANRQCNGEWGGAQGTKMCPHKQKNTIFLKKNKLSDLKAGLCCLKKKKLYD